MNKRQRWLLVSFACFVAVTLLFPPFQIVAGGGAKRHLGHAFVLSPPHELASVDASYLLVLWFGVSIVGAALWFLLRSDNSSAFGANENATPTPLAATDRASAIDSRSTGRKTSWLWAITAAVGFFAFAVGFSGGVRTIFSGNGNLQSAIFFGLVVGLILGVIFGGVAYAMSWLVDQMLKRLRSSASKSR
jgi:hypothetical protein